MIGKFAHLLFDMGSMGRFPRFKLAHNLAFLCPVRVSAAYFQTPELKQPFRSIDRLRKLTEVPTNMYFKRKAQFDKTVKCLMRGFVNSK